MIEVALGSGAVSIEFEYRAASYEEIGAPLGIADARAETADELAAALERALSETAAGRSYIVKAVLPE